MYNSVSQLNTVKPKPCLHEFHASFLYSFSFHQRLGASLLKWYIYYSLSLHGQAQMDRYMHMQYVCTRTYTQAPTHQIYLQRPSERPDAEQMVLDPCSGFIYLLLKALPCCVLTHTHTQTYGERVQRPRARSHTWVVCPSFPALCFPVYQQHHSDVLWFWPALLLPTYSKEPLHFPSSDDGNGIRLDRFIQQESEKRKKRSAGMSLVRMQLPS